MKKLLLLLLFIPLMSFGQVVTYETMDNMGVRTYFPIQNLENMLPKSSSFVISPVSSPK